MRNTPPANADVLLADLPVAGRVILVNSGVGGVLARVATALLVTSAGEVAVVALASTVVGVPTAVVSPAIVVGSVRCV